MKKNYTLSILLLIFLISQSVFAQSTEAFEAATGGENGGDTEFTDNSQTFTITSTTSENYNVFEHGYMDNGSSDTCAGCGWGGASGDNQFIDNTGTNNHNGDNNGSSFTIKTSGSEEIGVTSLYLFCSTRTITAHTGNVTITGKKGGVQQYTFTKSTGFSNVVTFTPSAGFTFFDFTSEGGSDNSQTKIDELVFTSTGNLDYMALDAFSWAPGNTLSVNNFTVQDDINMFPNPSSDFIKISKTI